MPRPILSKRIILNGNRYFGSLLFFRDKDNRECIKITSKLKIGGSTLWRQDKATLEKTTLKHKKEDDVSLDVSYKYTDSLLEIKQQQKGLSPEPIFVPVVLPPQVYLVALRVKLRNLKVVPVKSDDLMLLSPNDTLEVVLFVSFPGEDGKGFIDPNYMNKPGRMIFQDIPTSSQYKTLMIGVTDDDLSAQEFDLTFQVPEYKNQKTIIPMI